MKSRSLKLTTLFFTYSFLFLSTPSSAEIVDKVVAIVNNEIILQSDFARLEKKADRPASIEEILLEGKSVSDLKKDKKMQTEYLINEKILDSEVKKANLTASTNKVDQEIKQMAQRYKATPEEILAEATRDMKISTDDYKKFLKTQIERQSLIEQEVTSKVRVTDEEIFEEYKKRTPKASTGLTEVTLAQIYFNPKKGGDEKAQVRAESALKKLQLGEKFETVAEQTSEDPNFTTGGLLGSFKSGELNPEFETAIANLKAGQISQVFKSKRGYHILKVLDLKTVADPEFEKNKDKIRSALMERAFEKQFHNWLKKRREEATISINEKKL
jgi:peptidyl-prolyl cis-trans isomerase SurA